MEALLSSCLAKVYAASCQLLLRLAVDEVIAWAKIDSVICVDYIMCSCLSPRSWKESTEGSGTDGIETQRRASHGLADGHSAA